jgi:hypothetical protein
MVIIFNKLKSTMENEITYQEIPIEQEKSHVDTDKHVDPNTSNQNIEASKECIINNIYQNADNSDNPGLNILNNKPPIHINNQVHNHNNIEIKQGGTLQVMQGIIVVKQQTLKVMDLIPIVSVCLAVTILIINILLPGVGTFILAFNSEHPLMYVCYGVAQLILAIFLIGWIWGIVTGGMVLSKALEHEKLKNSSKI